MQKLSHRMLCQGAMWSYGLELHLVSPENVRLLSLGDQRSAIFNSELNTQRFRHLQFLYSTFKVHLKRT